MPLRRAMEFSMATRHYAVERRHDPHAGISRQVTYVALPRPPHMSLSGLVPGILANQLALRTRPPRREEIEEVDNVDGVIAIEVGQVSRVRPPNGEEGEQVDDADRGVAVRVGGA